MKADTWREQRRFAGAVMRELGLTGPGLGAWLSRTVEEMVELYRGEEGSWVEPGEAMGHVVGNMMNQAIFSVRYSKEDVKWIEMQNIAKEGAEKMGALAAVNFLPFLRFLPVMKRNLKFIKYLNDLFTVFRF